VDAENLDDSLLEEIESCSVNIARQAGQIVLEQFSRPLEVKFKGQKDSDPVTSADRLSEEYLKSAIQEKYPRHSILSEEGGALREFDSPFVWVIDPLDGTSNFMNGLPLFAVSVGVLWKRQPVAGSIFVPVGHRATKGVYHARLGKGAFLDNEKIEVSTKPSGRPLSEIPVHFGSHFRLTGNSRKEPHEARNLGSIALELTLAACGIFQYALFSSPRLWDVVAGVLLVKEAGGLSFTRKPGVKGWQLLERFQTANNNESDALEDLRSWSFPLVVGAPDVAGKVVKDIQIRHGHIFRSAARFWSQVRRMRWHGNVPRHSGER
jgi:myo-inositol-1(or 4)-monophosphatase